MAGRCEQYSNERYGEEQERASPPLLKLWLRWFTCGAAPQHAPDRSYRARQTSVSLRDATGAEEISCYLTEQQALRATHLDAFSSAALGAHNLYHRLSLPVVLQRIAPDPHTPTQHNSHRSAPQQECPLSMSSAQQLFAAENHLVAWSAPGTGINRASTRKSAASDTGGVPFSRSSSTATPSTSLAASRSAGQEPYPQRDHPRRRAPSRSHSISCDQLWLDPPSHIPRSLSMCMVEQNSGSGSHSSTPATSRLVARSGSSSTGQVNMRNLVLAPLTPSEQREVRRQRLLRNLNLLNGSGNSRGGSPIVSGSGVLSGSGVTSGSGAFLGSGALSGSGSALLIGSISAPNAARDGSIGKQSFYSLPGRNLGSNVSGVEASALSQDEGLAGRGLSSNAGSSPSSSAPVSQRRLTLLLPTLFGAGARSSSNLPHSNNSNVPNHSSPLPTTPARATPLRRNDSLLEFNLKSKAAMPGLIPDPTRESAIVDTGKVGSTSPSHGGWPVLAESYGQQMRRSGSIFEDLENVAEDEWLLRTEDSSHSFADLMANVEAEMSTRCGHGYKPCSDGLATWCEPRVSPPRVLAPSISWARSAVAKQLAPPHKELSVREAGRCTSAALATAAERLILPTS